MPTARIQLSNGTTIEIDGSVEEIERVVGLYGASSSPSLQAASTPAIAQDEVTAAAQSAVDLAAIVSKIKECDEAVAIEERILDQKNLLNRVLLPLYILSKYFRASPGMTSGEISKVLNDLGVPAKTPNVSVTLAREARPFVTGDSVRRRGRPVRYRLIRRGEQHLDNLLVQSPSQLQARRF